MRVSVIVNPIAGKDASPARTRLRVQAAMDVLTAEGAHPEVLVTERPGHGRELAAAASARGADLVIAWGGDGTVNEVASALAFGPTPLGILPGGAGNGLARMLRLPADPARALPLLLHGTDRLVDLGEIGGRLFTNVAGIGFDAQVAVTFARMGRGRRGFLRYAAVVLRELARYEPASYGLELDGRMRQEAPALLVCFANGRQWGNGAIVAPDARLDDGRLDVVAVAPRSAWRILAAVPRLFTGTLGSAPGVQSWTAEIARVSSPAPIVCHADGEPMEVGSHVEVRVRPRALRLRHLPT